MTTHRVLIGGEWTDSAGKKTFTAINPRTSQLIAGDYPVSPWPEIERAILAAAEASKRVRGWEGARFAAFLDRFAERLSARATELVTTAHAETALPVQPRLADVELPRTINQLKQAAAAARDGSWTLPTIDSKANIRSLYAALGPVVVFGPNNFPFAFNGAAGGDFAAAVAAGNPVIAKGHPSHPGTSRLLAEEAQLAATETNMPPGFVQLIYRTSHEDGARLVSHPLIGAVGYTGARHTGLKLKEAADRAGKPIYLELSSINPVFFLSGALEERGAELAQEFASSCLMGTGQFCTNPGLIVLAAGQRSEEFISGATKAFRESPAGALLAEGVRQNFAEGIETIKEAGAALLTGGKPVSGDAISFENSLLRVDGDTFLANPHALQTEAFGNGSLIVVAKDDDQLAEIADRLEGNLTGCIYSARSGGDDATYSRVASVLRTKVGRLLNDKMPTGVAVTPAMNHGGPYPATGHPGFTSVGIPSSIRRFAMLQCFDNVREPRLPPLLRDRNASHAWRLIDGHWTQSDV